MSDFEDESTSESEIEGDSSGSSEYTPEQQYQVRTDSNIPTLLPKETVNQNTTKCALLADKQPPHQVRNMLLYPQKYLRSKKYLQRSKKLHQNWLLKRVIPQKASALCDEWAMASNSDLDGEDYYIVEDDNESASSEYVPCINYPNDKVYPEDEKNGWVRLDEDTGPPNVYRFEGSCQNYMDLNEFTPGAIFDEFFEDRMWTILNENTNKYVHTKLRQAKDNGDKDPIEFLSEGVDQNSCAWLNNWEDTSPDVDSCWTWVIMFILIIITIALTWLIFCTGEKCMHVAQSGKIKSHSL